MAKDIVFCADGTWNGPGSDESTVLAADATNVLKVFSRLRGDVTPETAGLDGEKEKVLLGADDQVLQVAKYLHGVGDSQNKIVRMLGGVFGAGFVERIVRGYTFISRNYETGDRIHLVGFSRGAYTARSLGGMMLAMGLLDESATAGPDGKYDAETAYASGVAVWTKYRRSLGKTGMIFDELRERIATRAIGDPKRFDIPGIATIAVWDTVGSLGIPLYGIDLQRADIFNFADRTLSPRVEVGLHAVSIDERRDDFIPTLWDTRDGVTQVWFAGAHADVGGGYPEAVLSDISLDWMIRQLTKRKLQFDDESIELADPFGPHHMPWAENPFDRLAQSDRKLPADVRFHKSVQARLAGYGDYKPPALQEWLGQGRDLPANMIWID